MLSQSKNNAEQLYENSNAKLKPNLVVPSQDDTDLSAWDSEDEMLFKQYQTPVQSRSASRRDRTHTPLIREGTEILKRLGIQCSKGKKRLWLRNWWRRLSKSFRGHFATQPLNGEE
ncbi:unnamed protein product [Dibothriocephalus latus]|uniref:Uncharacterized protein n=1 Tax=Dibothriocephalus latus TaxID=60516 RepID=A0A3P7MWE8_DIBLA|nr:unnamed protein product [Dibothriocephalus latus]